MRDGECVRFLQWALPRMRMRWAGFRRVRGQVCKRIARRMNELCLDNERAYRGYLQDSPREWDVLDSLCRVSISRFYRDKMVFTVLQNQLLPVLGRQVRARGDNCLKIWSLGGGSGEEPYTLALIWLFDLQSLWPDLKLDILATDADPVLLDRARRACYPYSAVKNLPADWRERAFLHNADRFCLKAAYRAPARFLEQDFRHVLPNEKFDLVLCRNLLFTYYIEDLQCEHLQRLQASIVDGGALVIGVHETLPECNHEMETWSDRLGIYIKR